MFIIVMGVSGSGKSTVGWKLSKQLNWRFFDADDFHPQQNIRKMRQGTPLTDDDRLPWLEELRSLIVGCLDRKEPGVLACSALKKSHRRLLVASHSRVRLVYLKGTFELIAKRMTRRKPHFMKPQLLENQFAMLEEPEGALTLDAAHTADEIVSGIRTHLAL